MSGPEESSINELLAEAQAMSDALRGAYKPMPQVVEVSDEAGAVTITLEDHGSRVTRVILSADWKDKVAPGFLGMTVVQAIQSARLGNVTDFIENATRALDAPQGRPVPPPAPIDVERAMASLTWDDLGEMIETVNQALDSVAAGRTASPAPADSISGHSENRRVEVTLVAGQPSSVTVDEKWAERAGRQQISDALREAFESAYAEAATRPSVPSEDTAARGQLNSVINRLGLTFQPPSS